MTTANKAVNTEKTGAEEAINGCYLIIMEKDETVVLK